MRPLALPHNKTEDNVDLNSHKIVIVSNNLLMPLVFVIESE